MAGRRQVGGGRVGVVVGPSLGGGFAAEGVERSAVDGRLDGRLNVPLVRLDPIVGEPLKLGPLFDRHQPLFHEPVADAADRPAFVEPRAGFGELVGVDGPGLKREQPEQKIAPSVHRSITSS